MKVTQVIAELIRLQEKFGDLDVKINDIFYSDDKMSLVSTIYEDWEGENAYGPHHPDFFVIS
jgi:hypothetical protein